MVVLLVLLPKWMASKSSKLLQHRYPSEQLLNSTSSVNCFGLTSLGRWQVRGNGVMALTEQELWFKAFIYSLDITIKLEEITSVELVNSHLGKRVFGRQLLKVNFRKEADDSIAFLVGNPEGWKQQMEQLVETAKRH
jgi:hypothetical protein